MSTPREVARLFLPTPAGEFAAHAFECPSGFVYLALVKGTVDDGRPVLTRVHSECLTGDALGSLRCDCGVQLRLALRAIAAEGRGVLVYATGQEGRGIGLINKLRAYMEQENGSDTYDANLRLGLPVDARAYVESAQVLAALGVRSLRLLTNNPTKVQSLRRAGVDVTSVEPLATAPHSRNLAYLRTKTGRMGHVAPSGEEVPSLLPAATDASALLGPVLPRPRRPYVVLKYAQTLDGRIATASGDSKWISGEDERRISHALRAACDAVLVGVGTVLKDDPHLTVRHVPGASPLRVVLDSTLRTPASANVLNSGASTMIVTGPRADATKRRSFAARNIAVHVVDEGPGGVDVAAALELVGAVGIRSLLVEGGAGVITSLLAARLVDRLVVAIAPTILGSGTDAVGDLNALQVADALGLVNRSIYAAGDDLLLAYDVDGARPSRPPPRE